MAKENLGNLLELCATHKLDRNIFLELLSILMNRYKEIEHSFFFMDGNKSKLLVTTIVDKDEKQCLSSMVRQQTEEQGDLNIVDLPESRSSVKSYLLIRLPYFMQYIGLWVLESYITDTIFMPHNMQTMQQFYGILIGNYALYLKEQRSFYVDPITHCPGRMYFKRVFNAMTESEKEKLSICAYQLCAVESAELILGSEHMEKQMINFKEKLNELSLGTIYRVTDTTFLILSTMDIVDLYDTTTVFMKDTQVDVKVVIFNAAESGDIFKDLILKFGKCKQQEIKI